MSDSEMKQKITVKADKIWSSLLLSPKTPDYTQSFVDSMTDAEQDELTRMLMLPEFGDPDLDPAADPNPDPEFDPDLDLDPDFL